MSGRGRLVRPYAITGGRTRSRRTHLAMEAIVVSTADEPARRRLVLEWRRIAELAETPVSVAEVSAHLEVPLGVARVLVGDMADEGLVQVHNPSNGRPDIVLLERVLHGIRAL
ncbi:MAG TPA: DUF742 domain-containing protein [Acidimicrobiales bacterium]|nr:DUF742 domain-containing protein [Acidimicrobiales bacterium]